MWCNFVSSVIGFVVVMQIFFANTVSAIRCFQCNSHEDPSCGLLSRTDVQSPYLQECPPMIHGYDMFCRTILQEIKIADNMLRVTRSCGWVQNPKRCYKTDNEDHVEEVCQCFEDGCNASSAGILTVSFGIIGTAISLKMLI